MDARSAGDIVKDLTPMQRARVAEELYDIVFAHVPMETVLNNADDDIRNRTVAGIEERFAVEQDEVVQQLLLAYANDRKLEPILLEAITTVTEAGTLSIRSLLTAGMLINLILFNATTEVEIKYDSRGHMSWVLNKKTASPELMKQIWPFKSDTHEK